MSIIITIISNITVLVSHSAICCGYFMPTNHGISSKASLIVSPTLLPYEVVTRFACCFTRNSLSILFCPDQAIAKINVVLKQIFSFNLLVAGFGFDAFCVCFSVGAFSQFCHHETRSSFLFAFMHSFLFDLSLDHVAKLKNSPKN